MDIKGWIKEVRFVCNMGSLSFQQLESVVSKIDFYQIITN